jgi:transposase InsO family protein
MYPTWGSRILKELLADKYEIQEVPCARTIDRILGKAGLLEKRRRSSGRWLDNDKIEPAKKPNQSWSVDFKGWWRTRDKRACFPLTIRDRNSRFILEIKALDGTNYEGTKAAFEEVFERYGLPEEILSDNGSPFAAVTALQGLSRLSAWWVKLGIRPRRIIPGCPFMNGSHERMHRDIKAELQRSPAKNLREEQLRFNDWREQYNTIRPNQALGMKRPSAVYAASSKKYPIEILNYDYPEQWMTRRIDARGHLYWRQKRRFIAGAIAGETVGIKEEENRLLSIWFCEMKLGTTNENFDYPLGGNRVSPYSRRHVRNK